MIHPMVEFLIQLVHICQLKIARNQIELKIVTDHRLSLRMILEVQYFQLMKLLNLRNKSWSKINYKNACLKGIRHPFSQYVSVLVLLINRIQVERMIFKILIPSNSLLLFIIFPHLDSQDKMNSPLSETKQRLQAAVDLRCHKVWNLKEEMKALIFKCIEIIKQMLSRVQLSTLKDHVRKEVQEDKRNV